MTDRKSPITLERTFDAPLATVWELWTSKAGIESFWGPQGFTVEVLELDLRPGGHLHYTMTASAPEMVAFMTKAGMPLTNHARATYTATTSPRLGWETVTDFVPGVAPYTTANQVELQPSGNGVRVTVTFDAMHDDEWTQRAVQGRQSQLDQLGALLERRHARG